LLSYLATIGKDFDLLSLVLICPQTNLYVLFGALKERVAQFWGAFSVHHRLLEE
jgi:hypothetical protein